MTATQILVVAGASWAAASPFIGVTLGRAIRRRDRQQPVVASYPPPVPQAVNWLPFLPPVPFPTTPPFSQTLPAAAWFYDIPSDCLSDDAVHSLFDDIVRGEFA